MAESISSIWKVRSGEYPFEHCASLRDGVGDFNPTVDVVCGCACGCMKSIFLCQDGVYAIVPMAYRTGFL